MKKALIFGLVVFCAAVALLTTAVKTDAQVLSKEVSVAEILSNPSQYDQKTVTVTGYAFIVRKKKDRSGNPWMLISFFDPKDKKKVINVFGPGHPAARNGDIIKVTGKFKAKSKRGRYTFDNEIQTTSDKVVVVAKATG
ncbi:MAG: hypothetical protein PHC90_06965 [Syntrophorhabdaceae bacterium]|nr:hypothetical protein [Syntrophorhabdaceae bacterium]